MSISKESSAVAQGIQGAINATEQLAEISLGLRKTFDIASLISAMATAALDTGLNAKLPQLTEPVEQEIERVGEDLTESLVGDAIMGTPFKLETWIEDELASQIANQEAHQAVNYLDKLRQQKSAYPKANANGKGHNQSSTTGLPKHRNDGHDNAGKSYQGSTLSTSNRAASKDGKPTPLTREEKKRYSLESYWDNDWKKNVLGIPTIVDTQQTTSAPDWREVVAFTYGIDALESPQQLGAHALDVSAVTPVNQSYLSKAASYFEASLLIPPTLAALALKNTPLGSDVIRLTATRGRREELFSLLIEVENHPCHWVNLGI